MYPRAHTQSQARNSLEHPPAAVTHGAPHHTHSRSPSTSQEYHAICPLRSLYASLHPPRTALSPLHSKHTRVSFSQYSSLYSSRFVRCVRVSRTGCTAADVCGCGSYTTTTLCSSSASPSRARSSTLTSCWILSKSSLSLAGF